MGAELIEKTDYINRQAEEDALLKLLSISHKVRTPPLGNIIQINGPPLIGKSQFIKHCIRSSLSTGICTNLAFIDTSDKFLNNGLALDCATKIHNFLCSDFDVTETSKEVTKEIERKKIYLIIYLKLKGSDFFDFEAVQKIIDLYSEIKKSLLSGKVSINSDISLIFESRTSIKSSILSVDADIYSLLLEPLSRDHIEAALEPFILSQGIAKSINFFRITNAVLKITKGLPGAVNDVIVNLFKDPNSIHDLYDFSYTDNSKFPLGYQDVVFNFVENSIIAKRLLHKNGDKLTYKYKRSFIKKICSLKGETKTRRIISECIKSASNESGYSIKVNSRSIRLIIEEIFFITTPPPNSSDLYFYIDPAIKEIIMDYYFPSEIEIIKMHEENSQLFKTNLKNIIIEQNKQSIVMIDLIEPIIDGFLWHKLELLRIKGSDIDKTIHIMNSEIKELLNYFKEDLDRIEIMDWMFLYYRNSGSEIRKSMRKTVSKSKEKIINNYLEYPQSFFSRDQAYEE